MRAAGVFGGLILGLSLVLNGLVAWSWVGERAACAGELEASRAACVALQARLLNTEAELARIQHRASTVRAEVRELLSLTSRLRRAQREGADEEALEVVVERRFRILRDDPEEVLAAVLAIVVDPDAAQRSAALEVLNRLR